MEPDPRAPASAGRLRPLSQPVAVRVQADADDLPRAIWLRGRRRTVAGIDEVWRLDDEWWRTRPIQRCYVRCLLEHGRRLTLYQDLTDGRWWLQP